MQLFLLVALIGSFTLSIFLCGLALRVAPNFRSGERKEGVFRADQSLGNNESISASKGHHALPTELPLVGSRGMIPAMLIAGGATGWLLNFTEDQWKLLAIFGGGLLGFWCVGFLDDWRKVHVGKGIREWTKFIGVALVSGTVAGAELYFFPQANQFYPPYSDIPGIGTLFKLVPYAWPTFFVLLVIVVATTTSLAVDFSDGLDGLAGGLTFPAALAFAIINLSGNNMEPTPTAIASLVLAGAVFGFLPWNWPSAWKGRKSTERRRARMIMGDSGSLSIGGLLALIALSYHQEPLLIFIGGVFVIEGLSAVVQSRVLVKFFRRYLTLERFKVMNDIWFPHTEFPLPFLATPLHHHFDLLGWDRRRLVFGAWTLAALFAILGVASVMAPVTWERYMARALTIAIAIVLWQSGHHTRNYFIGTIPSDQGRKLALFYGYPYRIFGWPMHALVEVVEASAKSIASPVEEGALWTRTTVFDARAALGFYCFRAGYYSLAREQWERIPQKNLDVRPQIQSLLNEARRRVALAGSVSDQSIGTVETAMGAAPSPADSFATTLPRIPSDGSQTNPSLALHTADTQPISPDSRTSTRFQAMQPDTHE
jgi:UDP-N-acetylmuramyl pentapeptide phosphotransferase/UDP-N-acetylglucosamine-1-phosphate transferase